MTENQLLLNASRLIIEYIKDEFIKQGHSLTEAWENSVIAQEEADNTVGIYGTGYGMIIDKGITPDRIPYGREGTAGGVSKYILGLQRFWKLRKPGITDKQALRLAFATAEVQKKEGLPTAASEEYSATGKRKDFLEAVKVFFNSYIDNFIFEGLDVIVNDKAAEPKTMYL